jgi:hypothetical protein
MHTVPFYGNGDLAKKNPTTRDARPPNISEPEEKHHVVLRANSRFVGSNVLVSDWPVIYQTEDFVPNSSTLRDKAGAILRLVLADGADCVTG